MKKKEPPKDAEGHDHDHDHGHDHDDAGGFAPRPRRQAGAVEAGRAGGEEVILVPPMTNRYAWARWGDINAFFGLMLDNVAVMILLLTLITSANRRPTAASPASSSSRK